MSAVAVIVTVVVPFLPGVAELGETAGQIIGNLLFLAVAPVFCVTASVVISRLPRHPVGWMMLLIGTGIVMSVPYDLLIPETVPDDPTAAMITVIILGSLSWAFFIFPIIHLILVFPTGRLRSSRWWVLVGLEVALFTYLVLSAVFSEQVGPAEEASWTVHNPIGFLDEDWFHDGLFAAGLAVLALGAFVSLVLRFVGSSGVERQQMKWLLLGTSGFALSYVIGWFSPASNENEVFSILFALSLIGIGLAVAVAVLRYRLYEIDRVISRTVSYALVFGVLAGLVALVAAVVGTRFDDPLVVAGTTLAVAALFNPLRLRVQALVDRRFNRSRYDAEQVMDGFAASLRDEVDSDSVVTGWQTVVIETMHPSLVGVWVRE